MPVQTPPARQRLHPVLQEFSSARSTETSISGGDGEIEIEDSGGDAADPADNSKVIYIALGEDVKENKNNLLWCIEAFRGEKIVILHVHRPAQMVPGPFGGKMNASNMKDEELQAFRQIEWNEMMRTTIDEYLRICARQQVKAEHLIFKSVADVEKGIVELISHNEIRKLVMGAAADKKYSKKINTPTSKKARYVYRFALPSCQITFVCNGNYVCTREPYSDQSQLGTPLVGLSTTPMSTPGRTPSSDGSKGRRTPGLSKWFSGRTKKETDIRSDTISRSTSQSSTGLSFSMEEIAVVSSNREASKTGDKSLSPQSTTGPCFEAARHETTQPQAVDQYSTQLQADYQEEIEDLHARMKNAMEEVHNMKKEAYQESERRQKAELEAMDARQKARVAEAAFLREQKQRKEAEAAFSEERSELEKLSKQLDDMAGELQQAERSLRELSMEKASHDARIAEKELQLRETLETLRAEERSLAEVERERLEMKKQRDDALAQVEELGRRQAALAESAKLMVQSFKEFSRSEIIAATNSFDPSNEIGKGGFGSVFRGKLLYTSVAIKLLNADSMQGGSEFNQEVAILSKMRHPNLVILIGACLESRALVYEYLSNGSLEDRMQCKDGTPPLSWQARTRIAAEICSALLFLHSEGIVHGDLKPGNILLDASLTAKIGDFGLSRLLPEQNCTMSLCINTDPKGTFAYMDPQFLATGELTVKSDVYSFGIIILQLLTGKPPLWIAKIVQKAVADGNLQPIIDPAAGQWPFVQAVQLANIGLKCCQVIRSCRPDLESEVWRMLEPMRASSSSEPYARLTSEESRPAPAYFICPIFQEIMHDPHVAADGFTYEAEALRGWLDSGHDTSPMTNMKLSHLNLTPNHALRSAIQEWLMQS